MKICACTCAYFDKIYVPIISPLHTFYTKFHAIIFTSFSPSAIVSSYPCASSSFSINIFLYMLLFCECTYVSKFDINIQNNKEYS